MSQQTLDIVRANAETRAMVKAAMQETVALAQSFGVPLSDDDIAERLKLLDASHVGATTSMQRDIADKKPSELESQTGAIVRMGKEQGVLTPTNSLISQHLWPQRAGR